MTTKIFIGLAVLGVAWCAVLALVMVLSDDAPAALIPFPSDAFLAALPAHVSISNDVALGVVLISKDADFVGDLYRAGAWLVLPAGLMGCAPTP